MNKNMELVDLDGAEQGKDFTVETKTPFNENKVTHVYSTSIVDKELAEVLGLGVIEATEDSEAFLYNAMYERDRDMAEDYGILRLGIYYQIVHPEYVDTKLDIIVNQTPNSEAYLRSIFAVDTDEPIQRLKKIFESQKGKADNVVQFKK